MKRLSILSVALLATLILNAQTRQDYYVVEASNYSIEPTQTTTNPDETLTLSFTDSSVETFFSGKSVYSFEKAFPTARTPYLQRVYRITLDDDSHLADLSNQTEIEFVEYTSDGIELYLPNDYNDLNGDPMTQLDLINAQQAWNISTGDPSVILGIVDTYFENTHEDLVNQIIQNDDSNPSGDSHGTKVVGMAAAETDNDIGIAAIAFNSKVITRANGLNMAQVLQLAQIPGVRVINISWKSPGCGPSVIDAMTCEEIWNGSDLHPPVVLVAAAGNGPLASNSCGTDGHGYLYPAAYDHTIAVAAIGHRFPIGNNDVVDGNKYWKDVLELDAGNPLTTSTLNDKVDICAPGSYLTTTNNGNSYGVSAVSVPGTSLAAPMVTGVVALMLDANPNLTPDQVRDIIKDTADDISYIPNNAPYAGRYGTGRINAYRAVLTAECMNNPTSGLDLTVRNSEADTGDEPDVETEILWRSTDIWIRNQDDGRLVQEHENPEYDPVNPNYVYVRVTNKSCDTSTGGEELQLYWSKANTALSWPDHWNGTLFVNGVLMGDIVNTQVIPSLGPGEETILEFEWYMPDPNDFIGINPNPWHFCLLGRIKAPVTDPMTFTEVSSITQNVKNNNNLGWKNLTIIDIIPDQISNIGGVVGVGNLTNIASTFDLEFTPEPNEPGKAVYDEAEVTFEMDDVLYDAWVDGGAIGSGFDNTKDAHTKLVVSDSVVLENIQFDANEYGTLYLAFNFLTDELTNKELYVYNVTLKDATIGDVIGGETYEVRKDVSSGFDADAGDDEQINKNESVTITAAQINQAAVYNWYDPAGNLIYTGTDLTVSPNVTQTYQLEIISDTDGYKDYDEIQVTVNPYQIISLAPNPASSIVTVDYEADEANSAYLMVVSTATGASNNYILNILETQTTIDVSAYPTGVYSVSLVCDGTIEDAMNLVVE